MLSLILGILNPLAGQYDPCLHAMVHVSMIHFHTHRDLLSLSDVVPHHLLLTVIQHPRRNLRHEAASDMDELQKGRLRQVSQQMSYVSL